MNGILTIIAFNHQKAQAIPRKRNSQPPETIVWSSVGDIDPQYSGLAQAYRENQKLDGFDTQKMQEKPQIGLLEISYWEQRTGSIKYPLKPF